MGLFDPSTWSVEGFAQRSYDILNPVYGEDAPLEFIAEAVTPEAILAPYTETIIPAAKKVLDTGDDWLSGAIAGAGDIAAAHQEAKEEQVDIGDLVADVFNVFSDPSTSPLTPYAEAYVDWYQESTPTERIIDVVGGGTADLITDVIGTDVITGSISAVADPLFSTTILDPITEPIGEGLEKLIVPAAIIGGAYLLLK